MFTLNGIPYLQHTSEVAKLLEKFWKEQLSECHVSLSVPETIEFTNNAVLTFYYVPEQIEDAQLNTKLLEFAKNHDTLTMEKSIIHPYLIQEFTEPAFCYTYTVKEGMLTQDISDFYVFHPLGLEGVRWLEKLEKDIDKYIDDVLTDKRPTDINSYTGFPDKEDSKMIDEFLTEENPDYAYYGITEDILIGYMKEVCAKAKTDDTLKREILEKAWDSFHPSCIFFKDFFESICEHIDFPQKLKELEDKEVER